MGKQLCGYLVGLSWLRWHRSILDGDGLEGVLPARCRSDRGEWACALELEVADGDVADGVGLLALPDYGASRELGAVSRAAGDGDHRACL